MPDGEGKSLVTRFADAELAMGKAYAKGFEAFKASDFDAAVGDQAVKGIDREPARLLDEAAAKIAAMAATSSADASAAGKQATWIGLALMLAVATIGTVGAILFSRSIVRQLGADPAAC